MALELLAHPMNKMGVSSWSWQKEKAGRGEVTIPFNRRLEGCSNTKVLLSFIHFLIFLFPYVKSVPGVKLASLKPNNDLTKITESTDRQVSITLVKPCPKWSSLGVALWSDEHDLATKVISTWRRLHMGSFTHTGISTLVTGHMVQAALLKFCLFLHLIFAHTLQLLSYSCLPNI